MAITIIQVPVDARITGAERNVVHAEPRRGAAVATESTPEGRLGRAFVRGTIVGTILVFVFCGGISLLAGLSVVAALGIGGFTAFWGGPGFGGMMGATVYYSLHQDDF